MSCHYQPNYAGDAMFRGDADYRGEPCTEFTFDILDGPYIDSPVIPGLHPRDLSLDLDCDEVHEGVSISDSSPHSLYRTTDLTTNHGFLARRFNIQIDDAGDYAITLDNVDGFTPYIIVHRSSTTYWQGEAPEGGFPFTVSSTQTGPMVVEVTTKEKHEQGSCDVGLVCHTEEEVSIDGNPPIAISGLPYALISGPATSALFDNTTPFFSSEPAGFVTSLPDPLFWEITDGVLPTGLSLNSATALISGTTSAIGDYPFTIAVKKSGIFRGDYPEIIKVRNRALITNISAFDAWLNAHIFLGEIAPTVTVITNDGILYPVGSSILSEEYVDWYAKGFTDNGPGFGLGFHIGETTFGTPPRFMNMTVYWGLGPYTAGYQRADSSPNVAGTYNVVSWSYDGDPPPSLIIA